MCHPKAVCHRVCGSAAVFSAADLGAAIKSANNPAAISPTAINPTAIRKAEEPAHVWNAGS